MGRLLGASARSVPPQSVRTWPVYMCSANWAGDTLTLGTRMSTKNGTEAVRMIQAVCCSESLKKINKMTLTIALFHGSTSQHQQHHCSFTSPCLQLCGGTVLYGSLSWNLPNQVRECSKDLAGRHEMSQKQMLNLILVVLVSSWLLRTETPESKDLTCRIKGMTALKIL